jgi:RNA polymerase sigma-70 factor (ECF subfamily)
MPASLERTATPCASDAALRDADLSALVACGRLHEAFEGIMERYESKVFHLCMALLRDTPAAEDAAQESLLRVWRALARYQPGMAALSTWIYAITRNRCLTVLGQRASHETPGDRDGLWQEAEQLQADAPKNDAGSLALLRRLVEGLPQTQRTTLTLYYFEEHSVVEVATMLGAPEGTVKTHLHRARNALHHALDQHGLAHAELWL